MTGSVTRLLRAVNPFWHAYARLMLSRAKHRSLTGHPKIALRLSRLLRSYRYDDEDFFSSDGAPSEIARRRRAGFDALAAGFESGSPKTLALGDELAEGVSDLAFVNAHRVPFQYRDYVSSRLRVGTVVDESDGVRLRDLDGNWSYDLGGSYGCNLFGAEFYKGCIDRGVERARALGPVLGSYHPIIADNVRRLRMISGLDEISFHMSGTEAVMQAVRLARYHTRRPCVVRFCGAYHGWWDGVQVGPGNPRPAREVYSLSELSEDSLRVLRMRDDIACVLVNPIQALHPNGAPASDSALVVGERKSSFDKLAYTRWLGRLRQVCTERGIALIFDEVFLGFRLAKGGVQEYFGVKADLVTYGKSLGGGLPVGVLCGRRSFMRRFREGQPADICFARGTFNSHPYVMATMNEFLRYLETPAARATWSNLDSRWDARARELNDQLAQAMLPVRVANFTSVFTTLYTAPGRYHWMFQYYLRANGLALGWIGTGRFIFSHDLTDRDFREISTRFVAAARAMEADGWFWRDPLVWAKSIKRRLVVELLRAALGRRQVSARNSGAAGLRSALLGNKTERRSAV